MGAMVVVAEVVDMEAFGRGMEVWHGEREGTTVEKEAQEHDPHTCMGHRCRRHVSVPHKRHCRAARARICIAGEHRMKLLSTTTMAAMVGVLVGAVVCTRMAAANMAAAIMVNTVTMITMPPLPGRTKKSCRRGTARIGQWRQRSIMVPGEGGREGGRVWGELTAMVLPCGETVGRGVFCYVLKYSNGCV